MGLLKLYDFRLICYLCRVVRLVKLLTLLEVSYLLLGGVLTLVLYHTLECIDFLVQFYLTFTILGTLLVMGSRESSDVSVKSVTCHLRL